MYYTTLASSAIAVWRAIESYNCDPRQLFTQVGLDTNKLHQPNARYQDNKLYRLWKLAVHTTGDEAFGLTVAKYWHPTNAHALGFSWLASETLLEALERLVRYSKVITDKGIVKLQKSPNDISIIFNNPIPTCPTADEYADANLAIIINLCRASYGADLNPLHVFMQRPQPKDLRPYNEIFHAPIEYAQGINGLAFNKTDLTTPLPTANAQLALANDQIVADYLARYQRSNLTMQVRTKLIEQLSSGRASQESIAEALLTSLRNLQRNLKKEGTSYKEILEDVRRELAAQYMEQAAMSINEITYLLGFSEPANFSRAFKRWTGVSPSTFRTPYVT